MAISKKFKRRLAGRNPRLELDLNDLFEKLPEDNDALKQAIGGAIIDKIRDRAESGNFLEQSGGANSYSDEYASSFEFAVFGKSRNRVNLTASGSMLRDLDITSTSGKKLKFGFDSTDNQKKAHGHITGAVGKKRDFLGLTDTDLEAIRREFQPAVNERLRDETGNLFEGEEQREGESALSFLQRILRGQG